ncbi:unnamed protein product, partial [Ectocarpus sp. 12 AP-2014]
MNREPFKPFFWGGVLVGFRDSARSFLFYFLAGLPHETPRVLSLRTFGTHGEQQALFRGMGWKRELLAWLGLWLLLLRALRRGTCREASHEKRVKRTFRPLRASFCILWG